MALKNYLNNMKSFISNIINRPNKKQLYHEFLNWKFHGIESDALNESLRPEFKSYVQKAKSKLSDNASEDEILNELEKVLST